jgi:hypothetical protein
MLLSWACFASTAGACQICFPYPETTFADRLLKSKTVVLAKEKTNDPYSFYAVEVLKGVKDGKDINIFVDTTARRMLMQNSDDVVVFRQRYADPEWQYLTYADIEYQKFIRAILEQSAGWQASSGALKRIDFFAERLNHTHRLISEQAYLEVGRAPYTSIKQIAKTIPRSQIRASLSNPRYIEWHSLYILMLGQSQHPDDIAYIRKKIKSAAAYGFKINLAAWVTAFIETNPDTGVEEIETLYFNNKQRTPDELQEVWKSFSVLGSEGGFRAASELADRRHRIINSYRILLDNHPKMAGPVAKDLTIWQVRALVEQLNQIRADAPALDPDTKMAITYYLAISKRFQRIETAQ